MATLQEMDVKQIKAIQAFYLKTQSHSATMKAFDLNAAQEYAINIFGRDKMLPAAMLADYISEVKEEMTIGEIAIVLGFSDDAALTI